MLYILQGLYIVCTLWFISVVYWCDSWMAFGPLLLNKLIDWLNFNFISSNLTTMLCSMYVIAPVQMCLHTALHPARVCLQCYRRVWWLIGRTELWWVTAPSLHIDITVPTHTRASIQHFSKWGLTYWSFQLIYCTWIDRYWLQLPCNLQAGERRLMARFM